LSRAILRRVRFIEAQRIIGTLRGVTLSSVVFEAADKLKSSCTIMGSSVVLSHGLIEARAESW
jgi:hypothetical protein